MKLIPKSFGSKWESKGWRFLFLKIFQEDILQFFQIIDGALHEKLREQKAPLVLAGVEYLLPLYRQANTYQHLIDKAITGNPEILSAQELHNEAWPIVEADFQKSQEGFLEQFHELFGGDTGKASNNLKEIVCAAYYQRVDSLLVAVGQQQWGLFDPTSETVYLHPEKKLVMKICWILLLLILY